MKVWVWDGLHLMRLCTISGRRTARVACCYLGSHSVLYVQICKHYTRYTLGKNCSTTRTAIPTKVNNLTEHSVWFFAERTGGERKHLFPKLGTSATGNPFPRKQIDPASGVQYRHAQSKIHGGRLGPLARFQYHSLLCCVRTNAYACF